ncbi:MAG: Tat pathway signal protein, partial [Albidovulum sp.]
MTDSSAVAFSRRGLLAAFAATVAVAAPTCSNAFGILL